MRLIARKYGISISEGMTMNGPCQVSHFQLPSCTFSFLDIGIVFT